MAVDEAVVVTFGPNDPPIPGRPVPGTGPQPAPITEPDQEEEEDDEDWPDGNPDEDDE